MDEYNATVLLGLAQLIGAILCISLVRFFGKRPLIFISLIMVAICCSSAGYYAHYYGVSTTTANITSFDAINCTQFQASGVNETSITLKNSTNDCDLLRNASTIETSGFVAWFPLIALLNIALFAQVGIGMWLNHVECALPLTNFNDRSRYDD